MPQLPIRFGLKSTQVLHKSELDAREWPEIDTDRPKIRHGGLRGPVLPLQALHSLLAKLQGASFGASTHGTSCDCRTGFGSRPTHASSFARPRPVPMSLTDSLNWRCTGEKLAFGGYQLQPGPTERAQLCERHVVALGVWGFRLERWPAQREHSSRPVTWSGALFV